MLELEAEWRSQQVWLGCAVGVQLACSWPAMAPACLPRQQRSPKPSTHPLKDVRLRIVVPRLPVAVAEVTPDPVEEALRLMSHLRVRLCDAWIRAGVRVTLRPLLSRLPVVGAVQVRCGGSGCARWGCGGAGRQAGNGQRCWEVPCLPASHAGGPDSSPRVWIRAGPVAGLSRPGAPGQRVAGRRCARPAAAGG